MFISFIIIPQSSSSLAVSGKLKKKVIKDYHENSKLPCMVMPNQTIAYVSIKSFVVILEIGRATAAEITKNNRVIYP